MRQLPNMALGRQMTPDSNPRLANHLLESKHMSHHHRARPSLARSGISQEYGMVDLRQRAIPSVPEPARNKPTNAEFYQRDADGAFKPNAAFLKDHFFREGRLTEEHALFILERTTEVLRGEPNLVHVKSPVTICGDIHGQYYDLMKLFDVGGSIDDTDYLFLGDYVDRGSFGIECLLYLYALKLCYPKQFVLLRGNHECRHLTEFFTFKRECLHKYSSRVYEACIESFCALPIAALVDDRFFCVHGGISPSLIRLDDLHRMNRFMEPPNEGLLCDLLWCDPIPNYGHENEPSAYGPGVPPGTMFLPNATRGCSYHFTYEASCKFLERNGLLGIIRGHEAQDEGYTMHRRTSTNQFPSVITVFSAPNYLDSYHNRGAVLKYANRSITIRQYHSSSHPYWLPNFNDAFTWSLPFVGEKISEMLLAVLSICSEEELLETDTNRDMGGRVRADMPAPTPEEIQVIRNKILAVGKMQRLFRMLREENENATELAMDEAETVHVPNMRLTTVRPDVHSVNIRRSFDDVRRLDLKNERLPQFNPHTARRMYSAPSLRHGITDSDMEVLIKKTLKEDGEEGGVAEIAERIAKGMRVQEQEPGMSQSRKKQSKGHGHSRRPSPGIADEQMYKAGGSLSRRDRKLHKDTDKSGTLRRVYVSLETRIETKMSVFLGRLWNIRIPKNTRFCLSETLRLLVLRQRSLINMLLLPRRILQVMAANVLLSNTVGKPLRQLTCS